MLVKSKEPIAVVEVDSIFGFAFQFDAQGELKKEYGQDIDDWDFPDDDLSCIETILEKRKEKYKVTYVEDKHDGYFKIETFK